MERIHHQGKTFAIVLRKDLKVEKSTFLTPDESSLQLGFIIHTKGYVETPHIHKPVERVIRNLQQMLFVEKGLVALDFFSDAGEMVKSVEVGQGDTILIMEGVHSIRVLQDLKCLTVKQGPFLGAGEDKIEIGTKT